jgi:DNA replication protein DnaC
MIEELLTQLKMMGALQFYQGLKDDNLSKEDFFLHLLKSEVDWKSHSRTKRRLQLSSFPFEREWAQIKPEANPKIPFKKVMKFSDGNFVKEKKNLCFIGIPGLGKTHGLVAIGRDLCKKGYSVKFTTAIELVTKLEEAKEANKLSKLMEGLLKPNLLIIDELGFVPLSDNGARLLFDVFAKRYEKGSIAVSTNLSLPKWVQTFGSIELTTALVDRFTHRCDVFLFEGESYRFMESKKD